MTTQHNVEDRVGNMTAAPKPLSPTGELALGWDAWNRLKLAFEPLTSNVVVYQRDALNRKIVETFNGTAGHSYYSSAWQDLEERLDSSTDPALQNVRCLRYIDDLVLRDRDTNADGSLDERLYATNDALFSVTSLTELEGDVAQRFAYTPYGDSQTLSPSFTPDSDAYAWTTRFTGRALDLTLGLYDFRMRSYHNQLGRFLSRDPIGYAAGPNLYLYIWSMPITGVDPFGLQGLGETVRTWTEMVGIEYQFWNYWDGTGIVEFTPGTEERQCQIRFTFNRYVVFYELMQDMQRIRNRDRHAVSVLNQELATLQANRAIESGYLSDANENIRIATIVSLGAGSVAFFGGLGAAIPPPAGVISAVVGTVSFGVQFVSGAVLLQQQSRANLLARSIGEIDSRIQAINTQLDTGEGISFELDIPTPVFQNGVFQGPSRPRRNQLGEPRYVNNDVSLISPIPRIFCLCPPAAAQAIYRPSRQSFSTPGGVVANADHLPAELQPIFQGKN